MAWPTTNDPKTEFSTQRYTVGEMAEIDAAAAQSGMNRSEYIRNCAYRCQQADKRKQARRAASEGEPD